MNIYDFKDFHRILKWGCLDQKHINKLVMLCLLMFCVLLLKMHYVQLLEQLKCNRFDMIRNVHKNTIRLIYDNTNQSA